MKSGTVLSKQQENGEWAVVKILEIDPAPDGGETFHCLCYKPLPEKPSEERLATLEVLSWHAPVDGTDFRANWQVLCSQPVGHDEWQGFHEYLKQTDFHRYIQVTHQNLDDITARATAHYRQANTLAEAGCHPEAIEEYSKAVDLFPLFFEAFDNRAFSHMDLGEWPAAMADFEESLRIQPEGHTAFFSRGECLLKLGKLSEAEAVFREGLQAFPKYKPLALRFLETVKTRRQQAPSSVRLREVCAEDLPVFFSQQQDPEAIWMAGFTCKDPNDRVAFEAHWKKLLADSTIIRKTILFDGNIAGNVLSFEQEGKREICYWIGHEFWGLGIATQALSMLLQELKSRPLYAHVAKDNLASIRVLRKCGFTDFSEGKWFANARNAEIEELLLVLK